MSIRAMQPVPAMHCVKCLLPQEHQNPASTLVIMHLPATGNRKPLNLPNISMSVVPLVSKSNSIICMAEDINRMRASPKD